MQDELRDRVEAFVAEDLLVGLGALRMSLSWLGSDAPARPAPGFARLDQELARLEARSVALYRLLRRPAEGAAVAAFARRPGPADADEASLWHPNAFADGPANREPALAPAQPAARLGDSIDALLTTAVEARSRTGDAGEPPLDALRTALRQARSSAAGKDAAGPPAAASR